MDKRERERFWLGYCGTEKERKRERFWLGYCGTERERKRKKEGEILVRLL